jgi:hypothetical protein
MRTLRVACALIAFSNIWAISASSQAAFHLWAIKEIFSNHDGTVQFVELFTAAPGETALNGHTLEATSDGVLKTFTLNHNVAFPTTNKHLLFATAGFGSLAGGVTPDYVPLPANFFNPNAANISISWAHGTDIAAFTGSLLPKDGVNSLTDSNTTPGGPDSFAAGVNSPTNFAGAAGSVNVPPPGASPADFTGDGSVNGADLAAWRTGFGTSVGATMMQGNADGDGDVDAADFLVWQQELGGSPVIASTAAVPEPTAGILATSAALGAASLRRRRRGSRINEDESL